MYAIHVMPTGPNSSRVALMRRAIRSTYNCKRETVSEFEVWEDIATFVTMEDARLFLAAIERSDAAAMEDGQATSRQLESGEELMVPYANLSDEAKDLDRSTVRGVLGAVDRAGFRVVPK